MAASGQSFDDLVARGQQLDQTASGIQAERESKASPAEIQAFVDQYQEWYAEAIAILPADLVDRFRERYQGKYLDHIQGFLAEPLAKNPFFSAENSNVVSYWTNPYSTSFHKFLVDQLQLLREASKREQVPERSAGPDEEVPDQLEAILDRAHRYIRQLASRQRGRQGLTVVDEYDLQDLVHAALWLLSDDVRAEERTPSHGAGSATMDFLLMPEEAVVELKFATMHHPARAIADEIAVDIARYRAHPHCRKLFVFVFDPDHVIGNPRQLETDLGGRHGDLDVRVIVRPH